MSFPFAVLLFSIIKMGFKSDCSISFTVHNNFNMNVTINIDDYISSAESDNSSIGNAAIVKGLHKIESNDRPTGRYVGAASPDS